MVYVTKGVFGEMVGAVAKTKTGVGLTLCSRVRVEQKNKRK